MRLLVVVAVAAALVLHVVMATPSPPPSAAQDLRRSSRRFQRAHMRQHHNVRDATDKTFFKMHDVDGNNVLDKNELKNLFTSHNKLHVDNVEEIVSVMHDALDMNKDGVLSLEEYERMVASEKGDQGEESDMRAVLDDIAKQTAGDRKQTTGFWNEEGQPDRPQHQPELPKTGTPSQNRIPNKFRAGDR